MRFQRKKYRDINYLLYKENLFGKNGGIKIDLLMNRIFFEKLKRFKENEIEPIIKLKYDFESKIYSILDNIHFVKSNLSPFIQLTDTILFLLNIYFEFFYIKLIDKIDVYKYDARYSSKYKLIQYLKNSMNFFLSKNNFMGKLLFVENHYDIVFDTIKNLKNLDMFIKKLIDFQKEKI